MRSVVRWFHLAIRLCIVVVLTMPLAIGFQIGGMLLTGWGTQGFSWLAVGVLWLPTVLAWSLYLIELRNVKQAFVRGTALGLVASVALILIGLALIIAAGPMDGGI